MVQTKRPFVVELEGMYLGCGIYKSLAAWQRRISGPPPGCSARNHIEGRCRQRPESDSMAHSSQG